MEIAGTQLIPAPRLAVWNALNEPTVLKQCLPGCESVEQTAPGEFKVVVAAAIGPLRARFNGMLRMTEAHPPESCVMVFEGQGGAVGFGQGTSTVALQDVPDGTALTYTAKAQVGGKLAQIGSRMIDSVAKKMSDDFFKAFLQQFQAPPAVAVAPTPAPVASPVAGTPTARATPPLPIAAAPVASTATMVPGWWLAVALVLGSALTAVGTLIAH